MEKTYKILIKTLWPVIFISSFFKLEKLKFPDRISTAKIVADTIFIVDSSDDFGTAFRKVLDALETGGQK